MPDLLLATCSEGLSPLSLQKTLADVAGPVKSGEGVDTVSFDCSASMDDALRYAIYFMIDCLHSILINCNLYSEGDDWSELLQYVSDNELLLQVFQNCPGATVAVFNDTRPSLSRREVLGQVRMESR